MALQKERFYPVHPVGTGKPVSAELLNQHQRLAFDNIYDLQKATEITATRISKGGYTVANLPKATASTEGQLAYATNGRKVGEGVGAGTGVPIYFSNGKWRVYSTDAQVAA